MLEPYAVLTQDGWVVSDQLPVTEGDFNSLYEGRFIVARLESGTIDEAPTAVLVHDVADEHLSAIGIALQLLLVCEGTSYWLVGDLQYIR
jgi:hypothetical protein